MLSTVGVSLSRGQAQKSARAYAATFGDDECKGYVAIAELRNSLNEAYAHQLVIISFILVTLMFDSRVML